MKIKFLKLIINNILLCFSLIFLFSISNCYSVQNNNLDTTESDNFQEGNSNLQDSNIKKSDSVNINSDADINEEPSIPQKKSDDLESDDSSVEKTVKNKGIKPVKKKVNSQEVQNKEESTKQILLPEISFEDLNLDSSGHIENLKQKDNSNKTLKGSISWGLILLGIALIVFVIISNSKIPGSLDIKMCNKHDDKSKKGKKYYKNIQRRG